MQKINFQDYPNTTTPVNATNLNAIQSNAETSINEVDTKITTATTIEDFTSKVTFNESVANNTKFIKMGKVVYVLFQGEGKTHSNNTTLCTIPSGYRPSNQTYAVFSKNASAYGVIGLNTYGTMSVNLISSTTTSGRIYANFWYLTN